MRSLLLSAIAVIFLAACRKPAIPNPGDPCTEPDGIKEFCGSDEKTLLKCLDGVFVTHACDSCKQTFDVGLMGRNAKIEQSGCGLVNPRSAKVGALCDEGMACEDGGRHALSCVDKKMVIVHTCGGPEGCVYDAAVKAVRCDTSVGEPGDPCADGTTACSLDGHALLACKDGHLVIGQECNGPNGACTNINHTLGCSNQ